MYVTIEYHVEMLEEPDNHGSVLHNVSAYRPWGGGRKDLSTAGDLAKAGSRVEARVCSN